MQIMHLQKLFIYILDLIFPPSEDLRTVRTIREAIVPTLFHEHAVQDTIVLSDFRDPRIRALIHEAKFHGNRKAFMLLSTLIDLYLERRKTQYDIIIPIPLSSRRKRTRGYNQVYEILKASSQHDTTNVVPDLLKRTYDTRPQTDLSKAERLTNLRGAFTATNPAALVGKRILLVDDVMTTGATLIEARATLIPYGPKSVTLLALAH